VTATGSIPSGSLGLHYVAEIGNGRAANVDRGQDPVQNETDENNGKAFNLAVFARPDSVAGLQVGASVYHDTLTPTGRPTIDELILAAHAVYQRPAFEFLNEVVLLRHESNDGAPRVDSPSFYTQISRRWSAYRPYFRYEYVDVPERDPVFHGIDKFRRVLLGLRYDWGDSTALKVEYGRESGEGGPAFNTLTLQAAFTF
jgi:hypothetical protein